MFPTTFGILFTLLINQVTYISSDTKIIKVFILTLQFIFIFQFVTYSPLSYDKYKYPAWGQAIGWLLTLSSLSLIPAVMIYRLINTTGTIKEVNISRSGLYFKF